MARPLRLLVAGGVIAAATSAVLRRRRSGDAQEGTPFTPVSSGGAVPSAADLADHAPPSVATATPPPPATPGPSVTPPAAGGSETEREERATAGAQSAMRTSELDEAEQRRRIDKLVAAEEAAAAAEARAIGGAVSTRATDDEAMRPVYEAGGGEAEGFEDAEAELIENASHGDGRGDPLADRPTPELESDLSTARYGEPDEEDVTEVIRDPQAGITPTERRLTEDDPGEGPGIAAER